MTHPQIPDHVQRDPKLVEVWAKCHHILSPEAFEQKYRRTLLLPLDWPKLRKQVAVLKGLIEIEPGIIIKGLAEKSGIKYGRCREILYSREWLEWYCRRFPGSNTCHFFPLEDDTGRKLVPKEIRVEYLVAEFERLGFEFRSTGSDGSVLRTQRSRSSPAGCLYYLDVYNKQIGEYIRKRDAGLSAWWE